MSWGGGASGLAGRGGSDAWPSKEGAHWWGVARAGLGCGPDCSQGGVTPDASTALTDGLRLVATGLDFKLAERQLLSANLFICVFKMWALLQVRRVLEKRKSHISDFLHNDQMWQQGSPSEGGVGIPNAGC